MTFFLFLRQLPHWRRHQTTVVQKVSEHWELNWKAITTMQFITPYTKIVVFLNFFLREGEGALGNLNRQSERNSSPVQVRTWKLQNCEQPCWGGSMTGWMDDLRLYVLSRVFKSYQDDGQMIMKDCVQWNPVYCWKDLANSRPLDQ